MLEIAGWKYRRPYGILAIVGLLLLSLGSSAWSVVTTIVHPQIIVDNGNGMYQAGTTNLLTGLSATCPDGPPSTEVGIVGPTWTWTVGQAQFSSAVGDAFGPPPDETSNWGFDPISFNKSLQEVDMSSSLLYTVLQTGGYWQFPITVSVDWHKQDGSQVWSGSANTVDAAYPSPSGSSYTRAAATGSSTQPASPQETAVKLDITYTGPVVGDSNDSNTIVTGLYTSVHAGWPIQLGVLVAPADLGIGFTWTISGTGPNGSAAIKNWVLASDQSTASVTALTSPVNTIFDMFDTYYYVATENQTASVSLQGVNVPAAKTTFSVTKPSIFVSSKTGTVQVGINPNDAFEEIFFGPPPGQAGIDFTAGTIPAGFAGKVIWGQVYTMDDSYTQLDGTKWDQIGSGLDKTWPYGHDNLGPQDTNDNPNTGLPPFLNVGTVKIEDKPKMWLMYVPVCPGSIDVPIQVVSWSWQGSAELTGEGWWPVAGTLMNAVNPSGSDTNIYPTWTQLASSVPVVKQ